MDESKGGIAELLRRHGSHCMSYSTLQPGMRYFQNGHNGYVAYETQWGKSFALSDPVCASGERDSLVDAFVDANRGAGFIQASENLCRYLHRRHGYHYTQIGTETWFDLAGWDLKGGARKLLRKYRNRGEKLGVRLVEADEKSLAALGGEIERVKATWLKSRVVNGRRMTFLVRPETENEPDARRFLTFLNERLIQYTVCDPLYENGEVLGYNINLLFYDPGDFCGVNYFTVTSILDVLRAEGARWATLGLAPFLNLQTAPNEHFGLRWAMALLYAKCNFIYNFKGLVRHKKEYATEQRPVFYASRSRLALFDIPRMLRMCNVM